MSKNVVLLLVLIILTATNAAIAKPASSSEELEENSWTTKAAMPIAVSGLRVAVVNSKIYAIAGNYNYEYDPANNTWASKKPMPTSRFHFAMAIYQNKIYIIGGTVDYSWGQGPGRYCSANEVYEPLTDTWETKASMPTNRSSVETGIINGKIYVIGGHTSYDWSKGDYTYCANNEAYDPLTNTWETKTPMSIEKAYFDALVVNGKIYCPDSRGNEVYDPSKDKWTLITPMPTPVYDYMSVVVDNKIYILAGIGSTNDCNQIYDVKNNQWSYGKNLPTGMRSAAVAATTGVIAPRRIYIMGGGDFEGLNLNYAYDPQRDVWSIGAPMLTPRFGLSIAVINDLLYAIGGSVEFGNSTSTVEQYTPFEYGSPDSSSSSSPKTEPEPFPTTLVITALGASLVFVNIGLVVYFRKREHR